ncbi:MAG: hypothetical protein R2851_19635 [Caldilineaceae bacterium]
MRRCRGGRDVPARAGEPCAGRDLAAVDPWAETLLELACPACATRWHAAVDIGEFFWRELTVQAKRLLREVHLLARGYGWREADVLALHPRRRQAYLDMLLES